MAEKGRNPAINSCANELRYQATTGGTSRGTLLVRHGGLNSGVILRPTIAPTTVDGKCTNINIDAINYKSKKVLTIYAI